MNNHRLTLYAEGLLEPAEKLEIERLLGDDPSLQAELDTIVATLAAIREHRDEALANEPSWDELSAGTNALIDARPQPKGRSFLTLAGVATAAAAAAAALTFFLTRPTTPETPNPIEEMVQRSDDGPSGVAVADWPELEMLASATPEQLESVLATLEDLR